MEQYHGTTIISVRRNTPQGLQLAIGGDGQVTLGNIVVKGTARKVRKLYKDQVLAGFAGATADAFTLFERFEAKLEKHQGHLVRAAIELTKDWRTDRVLRKLEAGAASAVVESVKAASDVYAPVGGTVIEVNSALADKPETINEDAYGEGWLYVIEVDEPDQLNELLSPDDYAELLEEEGH